MTHRQLWEIFEDATRPGHFQKRPHLGRIMNRGKGFNYLHPDRWVYVELTDDPSRYNL
jgi:hypothetical protein